MKGSGHGSSASSGSIRKRGAQPKLTAFYQQQAPALQQPAPRKRARAGGQAKLRDCAKVVVLPQAGVCADAAELARLAGVLADTGSSKGQLLQALRTLSCYLLSPAQLEAAPQLGRSVVRRLPLPRCARCCRLRTARAQVAGLAQRVTDKLRSDVAEAADRAASGGRGSRQQQAAGAAAAASAPG